MLKPAYKPGDRVNHPHYGFCKVLSVVNDTDAEDQALQGIRYIVDSYNYGKCSVLENNLKIAPNKNK